MMYQSIGLLQQMITWYKIGHTGGQAHYYYPTGTLKQRPVTLDWLMSLCFNVPVRCMADFVPCDRLLQKAYLCKQKWGTIGRSSAPFRRTTTFSFIAFFDKRFTILFSIRNLVPRVSHLTAPWSELASGGGKMRDPGNEVVRYAA